MSKCITAKVPEHIDFSRLRKLIKIEYGDEAKFASAVGLSKSGLSKRFNMKVRFTADEMSMICDLLSIPYNKASEYFYSEKRLTSYDFLREAIKTKYKRFDIFAKNIGLSKCALSRRLSGKVEFTDAEINRISKLLNLSDRNKYFPTRAIKAAPNSKEYSIYSELRKKIQLKLGQEQILANRIGLSKYALSNRLNGKVCFHEEEKEKICFLLSIPTEGRDFYFKAKE